MIRLPRIVNNEKLSAHVRKAYDKTRAASCAQVLCHAPFKSMLFSPSGEVTVCHYNRGIKIGNYPDNSLLDIWKGNAIKTLRKKISKNDLSWGCQQCHFELSNGRFFSAGCRKYDAMPDTLSDYPVLIEFQLSNLCNLECIMCSGEYSSGVRENRELLSNYPSPYDEIFVEQLETFIPHLKKAYFTGGEPFIIPIYKKIWEKILNINPLIEMNISTNATLVDRNILEKGNFNVTVSIDTLNPENYAQIRKKGKLETVKENINYLYDYAKRNKRLLSVKFVLIKQNINDIPTLFEYFNAQNVQLYPKMVWLPFKYSLLAYNSGELTQVIEVLGKTQRPSNTSIQKENAARFEDILLQLKAWHKHIQTQQFHYLDYTSQSAEMLKNELYNNLIMAKNGTSLNSKEKKLLTEQISCLTNSFLTCRTNDTGLRKGFAAFLSLPADFLLFEILRGNNDKLMARFIEETK